MPSISAVKPHIIESPFQNTKSRLSPLSTTMTGSDDRQGEVNKYMSIVDRVRFFGGMNLKCHRMR